MTMSIAPQDHPRGDRQFVPQATAKETVVLRRFSRRLARLLQNQGLTTTEVARRIGTSKQAVSSWVRGSNYPAPVNLLRLANALDVAPYVLWGGRASDLDRLVSEARPVPIAHDEDTAGRVMMGEAQLAKSAEYVVSPVPVSESAIAMRVTTDANAGEINPGDILFVDPPERAQPGRWVLVHHADTYIVRRYHPQSITSSEGAELIPANKAWPTERMDERSRILGVVVGRHQTL